jgi:hypothetical protein
LDEIIDDEVDKRDIGEIRASVMGKEATFRFVLNEANLLSQCLLLKRVVNSAYALNLQEIVHKICCC